MHIGHLLLERTPEARTKHDKQSSYQINKIVEASEINKIVEADCIGSKGM